MRGRRSGSKAVVLLLAVTASVWGQRRVALGDWPEQRGPNRDGISQEHGLPEKWSLNGDNFLWRVPYGGRSTPVVLGNHLYVQNESGSGASEQERVMCLDPDTGKLIWEYRFNVFQEDVPPQRAFAAPAADPETGNVYVMSAGGMVLGLTAEGKLLWTRSLTEEFGVFTTERGRMTSPIIDGNLVIVTAAVSTWGADAQRAQRFIALDKKTGEVVYVANLGAGPSDTTAYGAPTIATIRGTRLLIAGMNDGGVYAMKPQTGEKVWSIVLAARGINTAAVVSGNTVLVSYGEENLITSGTVLAFDGSGTGDIKSPMWSRTGALEGFSTPIVDGGNVYQIDNWSKLGAFDLKSGRELWKQPLANIQKAQREGVPTWGSVYPRCAPGVMADGKIYVGTQSGRFFILRPRTGGVDVLSEVEMPAGKSGAEGTREQILAGAAISRGRIYFVTSGAIYALGPKQPASLKGLAVDEPAQIGEGTPAWLQVEPTELVLKPGQTVKLHARLFDEKGRFLHEAKAAWSLDGLKGTVRDGSLTAAPDAAGQAGVIKAVAAGLTGLARARVVRPMPWIETFETYADGSLPQGWINAEAGNFEVSTLDGQKVLEKLPDETLFKRIRMFTGPVDSSGYTMEADVRVNTKRRQMGDIGITAQRYTLTLYGNDQQLRIESWQPESKRTVAVPFEWKAGKWYRLKIRVQNPIWPAAAFASPARRGTETIRSQGPGRSTKPIQSATGRARPGFSSIRNSGRTSQT